MAVFQHLCEAFARITPSLAFFQHFYSPCIESKVLAGWEEWRHKWCYLCFPEFLDCLADPSTIAFRYPS
jgi:hypothetical protein